ncbi:MAG: zinc ribbon domain-containing protein [Defluviitaleaceae bacterium]|nr:zinc ribbon domain-containing protein [Defluviitaleaceae bacterium]
MPNYDLRCVKCSNEHNIHATMQEKSEKKIPCPSCGSFELETIFKAPPAFVKGVGGGKCPQRHSCGASCHHAS